jgi:molybdopterin-synthase adenylyltransferase
MIELVLAANDYTAVRSGLVGGDTEKSAILFASQTVRSDGLIRLLARDVEFPTATDYSRQGVLEAELKPEFVARITKRARNDGEALVFVHSHPGIEAPHFSLVDDRGERHLAAFLAWRHPELMHAALVISKGGMRARRLGTDEEMRVISLGTAREVLFDPTIPYDPELEVFDRQIRVFGATGQRALQSLRVAIVGLGGTGSLIAQELAHLGVRDFILVDPDVIEASNLNRVANSSAKGVGRPKVDVAGAYIETIANSASVSRVQGDVIQAQIARQLRDVDLIFGCTDSHGSRAVLQQVAYQYLIPLIDMGVTIAVRGARISHIFGRVQLLAPGLACFTCDGLLNAEEVRRDMMTEFERKADPYIQGAHEPAPAVMSLNGTVASLAVTMMLAAVTGLPSTARHVLYNAMASTLRHARGEPKGNCYICSRSGAFARGDSWPLFARER